MLHAFELQASALRNHYWHIRFARSHNKRRNHYRKAAKEKGHLVALGYSREVVRLYALYLRNPAREDRLARFRQAFADHINGPRQLTLF